MTAMAPRVLIVEDDDGIRRQYRWAFPEFELLLAARRNEAVDMVRRTRPQVAVVDLGLPPDPDGASEGLATLEAVLQIAPETSVIIATGNEDRKHALKAISLGAYDFFQKPVDIEILRVILDRALRLYNLKTENRRLLAAASRSPIEEIVAGSEPMLQLLRTIEKVAPADVSIMLLGESGTGKELLANAVHRLSRRTHGPFVVINCAAIPETLLESELFGHEKGAFTGAVQQVIGKVESANGGTLFLDEIGDLPPAMQVKILRFLQDHMIERIGGRRSIAVDVRVICATHQDLEKLIGEGRFREDLYYRLNEMRLRVPPLRERGADAALLAMHFLRQSNGAYGRKLKGFTSNALAIIARHPWRGNVRELENRVKRAVIMSDGPLVKPADLEFADDEVDLSLDLRSARDRAAREVIQLAIAKSDGNITRAAKLLGISRPTLYAMAKEHGFVINS
jgi:two-component system, NtrC family, response regulator